MNLERPGRPSLRATTKIRIVGATPQQTKENRRAALAIYNVRMGELAKRAHGIETPRPAISFHQYATWYLTHVTIHKRSFRRERSAIGHLKAEFGSLLLDTIDAARVMEWQTRRKAVVLSATVNRELDVLKHMLSTAVPKHLVASPIARLARLRSKPPAFRVLTEDEERRILAVADIETTALVILALDTLIRLGDCRRLEWQHDHGPYLDIVDPKVAPYRVPVTPRLRQALDALPRTGPYVFARRLRMKQNGMRSTNTFDRMFADVCAAAGVPHGRKIGGVTFHCLRHTGATRALARGASIRAVQDLGGWKNLKQLVRYTHPSWTEIEAAAASIGARPMHADPGAGKEPTPGQ